MLIVAILGCAGCNNCFLVIYEERTPTAICVANLEIQMCLSRLFVAFAPTLAMMAPPYPMTVLACLALFTFALSMQVKQIEKDIPIGLLEKDYDFSSEDTKESFDAEGKKVEEGDQGEKPIEEIGPTETGVDELCESSVSSCERFGVSFERREEE